MTDREADDTADAEASAPTGAQRVDKWLWYARIVKSRTLAATLVTGGKVRLNRTRIEKASQLVKAGDVLTVSVHRQVKVVEVLAPGVRRGPASEAMTLYRDLSPPKETHDSSASTASVGRHAARGFGAGRPTKRDRRAIERLTGGGSDD